MSNKSFKIVEQYPYLGNCWNNNRSPPLLGATCKPSLQQGNQTILGFLKRNLRNCSQALKELIYKQFILPVLEYTVAVWDP